jgi:cold shock CspA family protein
VKYDSLFTRLIANTAEPENDQACWLWTGKTDRKGYGFITKRVPGKRSPANRRAHREMEELMRGQYNEFDLDDDPLGPILLVERPPLDPDDETIDHLCYTCRCGNPDHWRIVTRVENTNERNERYRP